MHDFIDDLLTEVSFCRDADNANQIQAVRSRYD